MNLRHDPYQVFRSSKTPAGLYARQKWLVEAESPQWKTDFQETVTALLADQLPDGSWQHAPLATIGNLFGLHLAAFQTERGDWGKDLPFYQSLNALAHLNFSQVQPQLDKAFGRLFKTQNSDGSWGRTQPEWNTFLAIHALRSQELI